MNIKKRIGILTLTLVVAGTAMTVVDAVMVAYHPSIVPQDRPEDTAFYNMVLNAPVWWKIIPIVLFIIMSVGVIAFAIGADIKPSVQSFKEYAPKFIPVILTFPVISLSGIGDVISQTLIEILRGSHPFSWLGYQWWWTKYHAIPSMISYLMGHSYPSGIDMLISSVLGIFILSVVWVLYYKENSVRKITRKLL